jgi:hypothetical protein
MMLIGEPTLIFEVDIQASLLGDNNLLCQVKTKTKYPSLKHGHMLHWKTKSTNDPL